jgi:hypothetical protein
LPRVPAHFAVIVIVPAAFDAVKGQSAFAFTASSKRSPIVVIDSPVMNPISTNWLFEIE